MNFDRFTRWRPLFHYGTVKRCQSPGRAGGFLGIIRYIHSRKRLCSAFAGIQLAEMLTNIFGLTSNITNIRPRPNTNQNK